MDWRKVCIIDNKDQHDITGDVTTIEKDYSISRYKVVFENNPMEFQYGFNRISYYDNPEQVDIECKLVFIKGKFQPDIKSILLFGGWYKVQYFNDAISTVKYTDLRFVSDKRADKTISEILDYLIEVASLDDSRLLKQDEEPGFLETQLRNLAVRDDSALFGFFNSDTTIRDNDSRPIIAPFSSNKSQIDAIKNALDCNFSIIQGPPGTGKTQTILNIIANLIIRGKTVAVVSGNNEATKNVYEKLLKEKLDSLCATLGNKENVIAFFGSQPTKEGLKERVKDSTSTLNDKDMNHLESIVLKLYSASIERARLLAQVEELRVEEQANRLGPAVYIPPKASSLSGKLTSKQCLEFSAFIETLYSKKSWKIIKKLRIYNRFHFWPKKDFSYSSISNYLVQRYYSEKRNEILKRVTEIEKKYPKEKKQLILGLYKRESMKKLNYELNDQYKELEERIFDLKNYRYDTVFLKYYPIILSTTHSLKFCAPKGVLFDYVIIDESSQVDLASAAVALGQARKAVIVGDSQQLPHVIPERLHEPLDAIRKKYILSPFMDYRRFSLLESMNVKFGNQIPVTLLNEHYRCDPEIIGFCNKRFYDNQLVIQTEHREGAGISIIETPSNTARGRTNPRQAEIIATEIITTEDRADDIGIVAPYRDQVALIRQRLKNKDILVDTVHKFQGKERATIVLSTTSDRVVVKDDPDYVDFLNNPNLINVAISRAKNHLYVLASKELLNQEGTILQDLEKYVSYYSSSSKKVKSKVFSVFDLMFDDYAPILQDMKNRLLKISKFDSENIIATVIDDICKTKRNGLLSFKHNYPLNKIVDVDGMSDVEDRNFILSPGTHCDFVIYDTLDKRIRLIVEVDGKQHDDFLQRKRDERKDRILHDAGLKLIRIKTTDVNVQEKIISQLK